MDHRSEEDTQSNNKRWWIPMGIIAVLVAIAAYLPSPYVLERPGPVVDALGEITVENSELPVVAISDVETFEATGVMNVLSVNMRGNPDTPLSWLATIPGWIDPTQQLVPIDAVFPNNVDPEEVDERNAALMASSQLQSTAAALHLLDIPLQTQLTVGFVNEAGASQGMLEPGDIIQSVDGMEMTSATMIREHVASVEHGVAVDVSVERDGQVMSLAIVPQLSEDGTQPLLGIEIGTEIELPFEVNIEMDRIGGPSAGLTFALAQYELLTHEDILGGNNVSATGTIEVDGTVGPIGGLPQKIWGASRDGSQLMLFPFQNCADVPANLPGELHLSPVHSLSEAVEVIRDFRDGKDVPGIESCGG